MVVLVVNWIAHPGREAEAERLFGELAEKARQESGCTAFVVHRHRQDPRRFLLYEQYRDDAALEAHRRTAHFREIARGSLLEVGERIDGNLYVPLK